MVWNPNSGTMSRSSWGSGGKTFHPSLLGAKFTLGRGWDFVWQCSDLWFFSDRTDVVGPPGALEEATTLQGSDFSLSLLHAPNWASETKEEHLALGTTSTLHQHDYQELLCWVAVGWVSFWACIQVTRAPKSLITICESFDEGFNF